jgi:hypothetical protein
MYAYHPSRPLGFQGIKGEREAIEGKWPMRRTLLFVTASSAVLWAALITFIATI